MGWALKALEFGVLGLSAIMLYAAWRTIRKEQSREGAPRQGIIRVTIWFMVFSGVLFAANAFVQLTESRASRAEQAESRALKHDLQMIGQALNTKWTLELKQLPDSPQKQTLADLFCDALTRIQTHAQSTALAPGSAARLENNRRRQEVCGYGR